MGVLAAAGVAALVLVVTLAVRWFMPATVASVARQFGFGGAVGWGLYGVWLAGFVAPVALGAPFEDDNLALTGGLAVYSVGAYLLVLAVSSRDERRALETAEQVASGSVGSAATARRPDPVVTSGTPTTDAPVSTLAAGEPAVYAEWAVQERRSTLHRTNWHPVATDSRAATFGFEATGDRLRIEPGDRTFGVETSITTYEPDEPLPPEAATLFERDERLPAPDARETPVRLVEEFVPVDGPVTVAGVPDLDTGTAVIERGPPDRLLGSDNDAGGDPAVVLVGGTVEEARRQLRKRVVWLGLAGVAMTVAGQAAAILLTPATLPGVGL